MDGVQMEDERRIKNEKGHLEIRKEIAGKTTGTVLLSHVGIARWSKRYGGGQLSPVGASTIIGGLVQHESGKARRFSAKSERSDISLNNMSWDHRWSISQK